MTARSSHPERTDAARRAAYSDVMHGFAVALARHGLHAKDRARLLRCHRAAAEMAGRRPLFTASGEAAPSGTTWAENWQRAGEAGGIRHLDLDHLTQRPLIHAGMVHVGDLARRVEDGTLLAVPGIGAKRAEEIRAAVNRSPTSVL
jgi:hypothetical protein